MSRVKKNGSNIPYGTSDFTFLSRLHSILYGDRVSYFLHSFGSILPDNSPLSNSLYILQARAEPNPPGFDAPDPEQNPNFNCPHGYFFEGNHETKTGQVVVL